VGPTVASGPPLAKFSSLAQTSTYVVNTITMWCNWLRCDFVHS